MHVTDLDVCAMELPSRWASMSLTDLHAIPPGLKTRQLLLDRQLSSMLPLDASTWVKGVDGLMDGITETEQKTDEAMERLLQLTVEYQLYSTSMVDTHGGMEKTKEARILLRHAGFIHRVVALFPHYVKDVLLPSMRHAEVIHACEVMKRVSRAYPEMNVLQRLVNEFVPEMERKHVVALLGFLEKDTRGDEKKDAKARHAQVLAAIGYLKQLEHVVGGAEGMRTAVVQSRCAFIHAAWEESISDDQRDKEVGEKEVLEDVYTDRWMQFSTRQLPEWTTRARTSFYQLKLTYPHAVSTLSNAALWIVRDLEHQLELLFDTQRIEHEGWKEGDAPDVEGIAMVISALHAASARLAPVGLDIGMILGYSVAAMVKRFVLWWLERRLRWLEDELPDVENYEWKPSLEVTVTTEEDIVDDASRQGEPQLPSHIHQYTPLVSFVHGMLKIYSELWHIAVKGDAHHVREIGRRVLKSLKACREKVEKVVRIRRKELEAQIVAVSEDVTDEHDGKEGITTVQECERIRDAFDGVARYVWDGLRRVHAQESDVLAIDMLEEVLHGR